MESILLYPAANAKFISVFLITTFTRSNDHAQKVSWPQEISTSLNTEKHIREDIKTNLSCRKSDSHGINTICSISFEPKSPKIGREPFTNRNGLPNL